MSEKNVVQENFGYKQVMAPENSDSKKCLVKKITGLETFLVKKKLGKQLIFASTKIGVQKKKFLRLVGWWEGGGNKILSLCDSILQAGWES